MENMTLKDMSIGMELCVHIHDIYLQFKQEGIHRKSLPVYAMIAMGMDGMQYF